MFNVVTISREYGSGGSLVGSRVAELLGWQLGDRQIIERVSALGKLDPDWVQRADEQACAWWERLLGGFRHGGPEAYVGGIAETGVDRDSLQKFTARVIEEIGKKGQCVVVGRAAQCVLQKNPHALRVLIYAPLNEKLERMKKRHPHERDLPDLMHRLDAVRRHYTQDYYGCDPYDRSLYHLCINSTIGIDACAEIIVNTVRLSEQQPSPQKAEAAV